MIVEWWIVAVGTYVHYSWDIMEPVAYCMGLINLSVGYGMYVFGDYKLGFEPIYSALL
jgi:hypothetical protein